MSGDLLPPLEVVMNEDLFMSEEEQVEYMKELDNALLELGNQGGFDDLFSPPTTPVRPQPQTIVSPFGAEMRVRSFGNGEFENVSTKRKRLDFESNPLRSSPCVAPPPPPRWQKVTPLELLVTNNFKDERGKPVAESTYLELRRLVRGLVKLSRAQRLNKILRIEELKMYKGDHPELTLIRWLLKLETYFMEKAGVHPEMDLTDADAFWST
jgi:hypothetical protein